MKNTYLYRLCTVAVATCLMWGTASFAEKTAPKSSARFINIETPFRCAINRFQDLDIATTLALKDGDFKLTFFDKMDDLPRYEVNGLSFTKQPIDEALQKLVDEADITVYTEDGFYPSMDASDVYGELTDVIDELTKAGEVFYRYDAMKKEEWRISSYDGYICLGGGGLNCNYRIAGWLCWPCWMPCAGQGSRMLIRIGRTIRS